ncbi:uncharacterized protein BYT42DRAFT_547540 [Radiomyces spectabilis]|uniref:uncharacterized protein n=1 Tax=Radiomyces spectabilis TaxID=64574 RepID=UPI002220DFF8|nr:uncharacterized protein BYT42DRAFT_547540 [Radiomyces spectabilis]KAI8374509.1 hypothetical protein BYT42DRAFT_547540 [Radiomyces spectabilis]
MHGLFRQLGLHLVILITQKAILGFQNFNQGRRFLTNVFQARVNDYGWHGEIKQDKIRQQYLVDSTKLELFLGEVSQQRLFIVLFWNRVNSNLAHKLRGVQRSRTTGSR